MLAPGTKERDAILQQMSWAFTTLKSAEANFCIGYGFPESQNLRIREEARAGAKQQIARLRECLDKLEKSLDDTV